MGFKDYLTEKKNKIVIKENNIPQKNEIKKVIIEKNLKDYSTEELLEEVNKRNVNKQKEIIEQKNDPMMYASMILEDSEFDPSKLNKGQNKEDNDMMDHVMDLF